MLDWIRAFFASDKILKEDHSGEYVPFNEIISEATLSKLHGIFEAYINQPTLTENFQDVLKRDLFSSPEWENTAKIMNNLEIKTEEEDLLRFLESNCYQVWFAKQQIEGRTFTDLEKTALAGFVFFVDNIGEDDYPFTSVHESVNEQRETNHPIFTDKVFEWNIVNFVKEYKEFTAREGSVTV